MSGLTPQQELFAREYMKDLNGTQAAKRAGYAYPRQTAPRLLSIACVQELIRTLTEERNKRMEITVDEVIESLRAIRDDAMRPAVDSNQNESMANHGAAIRANELLGRHIGMWPNKVELTVDQSIADRLDRAERRIEAFEEQKQLEAGT